MVLISVVTLCHDGGDDDVDGGDGNGDDGYYGDDGDDDVGSGDGGGNGDDDGGGNGDMVVVTVMIGMCGGDIYNFHIVICFITSCSVAMKSRTKMFTYRIYHWRTCMSALVT